MHLLYVSAALVCAVLHRTATAAAIPQIDDGLGAQLTDDFNTALSSVVNVAASTQSSIAQTNLTGLPDQEKSPAIQLNDSGPVISNSSNVAPTPTQNPQSIPSATAPTLRGNSLQAQSPNAVNQVFDSSTNTSSTSIPITANSSSPPPPIQDNGLLSQDTNPIDTAFASTDNSIINTDPQPVNESIPQGSQKGIDLPKQQAQSPPDNGLQAQPNATEITFAPQDLNTPPNPTPTSTRPSPPPPSSTPTPPPPKASPTPSPTVSFIPQDNGLQAQDVSSENDDVSPASNQTAVNYPHQFHDADTGELLVPVVQDNGLQAQDSGGANVDWSPGEEYGGGLGGDINVPEVVNGGVLDQE